MKEIRSRIKRRPVLGGLAAVAITGLTAPAHADWFDWWRPPSTEGNLVEVLASKPKYSTLVTAVKAAGLEDALATVDGATVFAPTNAAFDALPEGTVEFLLSDEGLPALAGILRYHVLGEELRSRELTTESYDTLLDGESVDVEVVRSWWFYRQIEVDQARVIQPDLEASNGVIHGIDAVLDPAYAPVPTILELAAGNPEKFGTLAELVEKAGLARLLAQESRDLTVFAPTDDAFAALDPELVGAVVSDPHLLRKVLLNHILYGRVTRSDLETGPVRTLAGTVLDVVVDEAGAVTIDGVPVTDPDIAASNGVVHVVESVLVPELPRSLVDVAESRDDLSTFVTALGAAGLTDTFDQTSRWPQFTIFAPNDDAFGAVDPGVLAGLLGDPDALAGVLELHVVPGRLTADRLRDGQKLRTLSGDTLTVAVADGGVTVNGVAVVEADVKAVNGVIHVIGAVLEDDPFTVADLVAGKPYLSTLAAAIEAAGLTSALDDPDADLTVFAPTDQAFAKLPKGTLEALLAEEPRATLTDILRYHVAGESLTADELVEAESVTTLLGSDVSVEEKVFRWWRWEFRRVLVNGAYVYVADLETDNGIVHVIGDVLLPPSPPDGEDGAEG